MPFSPRRDAGHSAMAMTPAGWVDVPRWLADQHRRTEPGTVLALDPGLGPPEPGERVPTWSQLLEGAGFLAPGPATGGGPVEVAIGAPVERQDTLTDLVAPDLTLLIIGLNPSPTSVARGVPFARGGNRFWPAALAAGAAALDRDPDHALAAHGLGFTDIVKRPTRQAAELTTAEFAHGLTRLDALVGWLQPRTCVMVGLAGWRRAGPREARTAAPGWQPDGLGGRPLYLMPSTSGLNARSSLAELTAHLAAAMAGPGTSGPTG